MSRGKYLSLEEARKTGQIDRFCKEHPFVPSFASLPKTIGSRKLKCGDGREKDIRLLTSIK